MSAWSATKAKRVYAALPRMGWTLKKTVGSHTESYSEPAGQILPFAFTIAKRWDRPRLQRSGKKPVSVPKILEFAIAVTRDRRVC